jgi:hypothetical protein
VAGHVISGSGFNGFKPFRRLFRATHGQRDERKGTLSSRVETGGSAGLGLAILCA